MDTSDRVRQIIARILAIPPDEVELEATLASLTKRPEAPTTSTPDASLISGLSADSLNRIEFLMAVEEEFSVEIPDPEADAWFRKNLTIREISFRINHRRNP